MTTWQFLFLALVIVGVAVAIALRLTRPGFDSVEDGKEASPSAPTKAKKKALARTVMADQSGARPGALSDAAASSQTSARKPVAKTVVAPSKDLR
jgi:hypothetical protein